MGARPLRPRHHLPRSCAGPGGRGTEYLGLDATRIRLRALAQDQRQVVGRTADVVVDAFSVADLSNAGSPGAVAPQRPVVVRGWLPSDVRRRATSVDGARVA